MARALAGAGARLSLEDGEGRRAPGAPGFPQGTQQIFGRTWGVGGGRLEMSGGGKRGVCEYVCVCSAGDEVEEQV